LYVRDSLLVALGSTCPSSSDAVRDYLVHTGGVDPLKLEAVGRGMDAPSRRDDPFAAQNRRVEIRNLGGKE
jgi:flagellar motor protein MotB